MDVAFLKSWWAHARPFVAPTANNPEAGVRYDETSARRAWTSLGTHLADALA
jgi:hypothetical protein